MSKPRLFVAIDNGVTATIGAVAEDGSESLFTKVPVYKAQEYMSSKVRFMTHIDQNALHKFLSDLRKKWSLVIVTERPLVSPKLFKATMSGVRAHEILLATLRTLKLELYATWDSRAWQHPMLGECEKGTTKIRSVEEGLRLYPQHSELINKHKDADAILMAHQLRRCVLEQEKQAAEKKSGDLKQ